VVVEDDLSQAVEYLFEVVGYKEADDSQVAPLAAVNS
jgi:hypothetical protein